MYNAIPPKPLFALSARAHVPLCTCVCVCMHARACKLIKIVAYANKYDWNRKTTGSCFWNARKISEMTVGEYLTGWSLDQQCCTKLGRDLNRSPWPVILLDWKRFVTRQAAFVKFSILSPFYWQFEVWQKEKSGNGSSNYLLYYIFEKCYCIPLVVKWVFTTVIFTLAGIKYMKIIGKFLEMFLLPVTRQGCQIVCIPFLVVIWVFQL